MSDPVLLFSVAHTFTLVSPAVGINKISCVYCLFCSTRATHTQEVFYPTFILPFLFSISPFVSNFYFIPLVHSCDLPYLLCLNGKTYKLSSDERARFIRGPEGSYQACSVQ